jgi:hypothetical protein
VAEAARRRGRTAEFGEPVTALEHAVLARQVLAAGDEDSAVLMADLEVREWRAGEERSLRTDLALVVALENLCYLREQAGDTQEAVSAGAELVTLCGQLADLEGNAWDSVPEELRAFAVGQLPRRLIRMIGLYALVGRHDDALLAAEQAQSRSGGVQALGPLTDTFYGELTGAVYLELRRRALAARQADV